MLLRTLYVQSQVYRIEKQQGDQGVGPNDWSTGSMCQHKLADNLP